MRPPALSLLAIHALALAVLPGSGLAAAPADTYAAIDRAFDEFQVDAHVPGLVYGIVQDGRVVRLRATGVRNLETRQPVDADTLFRIASMTKSFTALAVLRLRDEGRLRLDEPAATYVPELRGWKPATGDSPPIRVRELLTHTAGFVTDDPWGDRQTPLPEAEFSRLLRAGVPYTRPTATAMEYSNLGYALLGRIVSNVARRPYADYIGELLLRRLGMTSSGFEVTSAPLERRALGYRWEDNRWTEEPTMAHGAFGAMGGLQVSANDYVRYVTFLLDAWPARDDPDTGPIRRSTVRELAQGANYPQLRDRPGRLGGGCKHAVAYGMGMRVTADCDLGVTLSHGGGYPGYGSFVLLLPELRTAVFALTNRTYAGPAGIVWDTAMMLHQGGLLARRPPASSAALEQAYAAAGRIFAAGSVDGERAWLAMNFLMDRSAENWAHRLATLAAEVGTCSVADPITPTGLLSGEFTWRCAHGRVQGALLLAPTATPQIQKLELTRLSQ